MPESIPFPAQPDEDGRGTAPGRQFTDIAAYQDVGGGIPEWRGLRHVLHHPEPPSGGCNNSFHFTPQEFKACDEQDVAAVSGEPDSGFRACQ